MSFSNAAHEFNKKYAQLEKKLDSTYNVGYEYISQFISILAENIYWALEFIVVVLFYKKLVLGLICPIFSNFIYKPLKIIIFFADKIAYGICDFVASSLYSLLSLIVFVIAGVLRLLLAIIDKLLLPFANRVSILFARLFYAGDVLLVGIFATPDYCVNVIYPKIIAKLLYANNRCSEWWGNLPLYFKSLTVVVLMPIFAASYTLKNQKFTDYLKNTAVATASVASLFVSLSAPIPTIIFVAVKVFLALSWVTGLYYAQDIVKADWKKLDKIELKDFLPSSFLEHKPCEAQPTRPLSLENNKRHEASL